MIAYVSKVYPLQIALSDCFWITSSGLMADVYEGSHKY